jgi:hypothetical protein
MRLLFLCCGLVAGLLMGSGCAGESGTIIWSLASSAISRANGGCYAQCHHGTHCNEATGYCEPAPCRGECKPYEQCVGEGLRSRCVTLTPPGSAPTQEPPAATASEPTP